jgi:hypothetical protein
MRFRWAAGAAIASAAVLLGTSAMASAAPATPLRASSCATTTTPDGHVVTVCSKVEGMIRVTGSPLRHEIENYRVTYETTVDGGTPIRTFYMAHANNWYDGEVVLNEIWVSKFELDIDALHYGHCTGWNHTVVSHDVNRHEFDELTCVPPADA